MTFLDILSQIINGFTYLYLAYVFYGIFFKTKYEKWVMILYFVIGTPICTLSLLFLRGTVWHYLVIFPVSMVLPFLFDCKILNKFVFWVIMYGIQAACESFVGTIMLYVTGFYGAFWDGALFFLGMLLSKLLVYFIVVIIKFRKQKNFKIYLNKNNLGLFFIPLASIVVYAFQTLFLLEYKNPSNLLVWLIIVSAIIICIANVSLFDFIDTLYKNTVNESRVNAANEIIANQTAQYKALIDHNREVMKIQHDNKNFCIGLIDDLDSGRVEEAKQKLRDAHSLSLEEQRIHGNIISFLVGIKSKEAESKKVTISYDFEKLPSINIPSTDLAIILGNALDNAIEAAEACEGERKVELFVSLRNENVVITIRNPVLGNVDVNNLKTGKSDKSNHGFGVISMKNIAKKYNGEVIFYEENGLFTTSIVMNNTVTE